MNATRTVSATNVARWSARGLRFDRAAARHGSALSPCPRSRSVRRLGPNQAPAPRAAGRLRPSAPAPVPAAADDDEGDQCGGSAGGSCVLGPDQVAVAHDLAEKPRRADGRGRRRPPDRGALGAPAGAVARRGSGGRSGSSAPGPAAGEDEVACAARAGSACTSRSVAPLIAAPRPTHRVAELACESVRPTDGRRRPGLYGAASRPRPA